MTPPVFSLHSEADTIALATQVGAALRPGDVLLLQGPVGAGKSFFARALIQSLQDNPEDVPSPTFTLVQTYETKAGEIWHADLYRLSGPDEAAELGLLDAMDTAICLIEWPDRLAGDAPDDATTCHFETGKADTHRTIAFHGKNARRIAGHAYV